MRYRHCIPVESTSSRHTFAALDKILRKYNKAGFTIKVIHCDRAFIPISDDMMDEMGIEIDPVTAGDH